MNEDLFLLIGLTFFFVGNAAIWRSARSDEYRREERDRELYSRKLHEAERFGYEGSRLQKDAQKHRE